MNSGIGRPIAAASYIAEPLARSNSSHHRAGMAPSLCSTCRSLFHGSQKLREAVPHHQSRSALHAAAKTGCYICRRVDADLGKTAAKAACTGRHPLSLEAYLSPVLGLPNGWLKLSIEECDQDELARDFPRSGEDNEAGGVLGVAEQIEELPDRDLGIWGFIVEPAQGKLPLPCCVIEVVHRLILGRRFFERRHVDGATVS